MVPITIAIPTYNRPKEFNRICNKLSIMLDNIDYPFEFIFADNHSSVNAIEVAQFHFRKWEGKFKIKYIRRQFNIGLIANVMRLFEESSTDWMIIVGDDDLPVDNFYSILINTINNDSKNSIAIKFKTVLDKGQTKLPIHNNHDLFCYINTQDRFSSFLLISSWLINISKLKDYVRFSYAYSTLNMPHIIPILYGLEHQLGFVYFSEATLIKWNPPSEDSSWSTSITFSMMFHTFPLFFDILKTEKLVNSMFKSYFGNSFLSRVRYFILIKTTYPKSSFSHLFKNLVAYERKFLIVKVCANLIIFLSRFSARLRLKVLDIKGIGNDTTRI